MKSKSILVGVIFLIVACAALGFIGKNNTEFSSNLVQNESKTNNPPNVVFDVTSNVGRAITQSKLQTAKKIDEIIEYYPSNWIENYDSVVIKTVLGNKEIIAKSADNQLTEKQIKVLKLLDISDDIHILVAYKIKNGVTGEFVSEQMKIHLVLKPETEASFIGGDSAMTGFFLEKSKDRVELEKLEIENAGSLLFTVNTEGKTERISICDSTGRQSLDELLINMIEKMPNWIPAKGVNGESVRQRFLLQFGKPGC